ncbi:MAG: tyrosine-protein phosphatase [Planctomycetia bacterium]|nr:tyrosine-protein phosphatase [Planctomycetia bacterium]
MKKSLTLCVAALLSALASAVCYAADRPELLAPINGEERSLTPDEVAKYKSPEARDWDLSYRPVELKGDKKDCSQPKPVTFKWNGVDADAAYKLEVSASPEFDAIVCCKDCGDQKEVEIYNLNIGTTYYWRVTATSGDAQTVSDVASFKTAFDLPRWFNVPSITNVRDAGGWKAANGKRMKQGLVFRGSEMEPHNDGGRVFELTAEGKDIMLNLMGIQTDLELRGPGEWDNDENYYSPLGRENVKWINFPINYYGAIFNDRNKELFRNMFHVFAQRESYPIYIHCVAGADRTGTTLIALKSVLGVSDSDMFFDYEMTSFSAIGSRRIGQDGFQGLLKKLDEFEGETYGQKFVAYLKSAGVTDEEMDAIREILLEDAQD